MTVQQTHIGYRFPINNRLKKSSQFKQILDKGQKLYGQYWILFYAENHLYPDCTRLGIIVSKKVSLLAVQRNRLKRIVREFFRQNNIAANKIAYDIVIVAKKSSIQYCQQNTQKLVHDLAHLTYKFQQKIR